MSNKKVNSFHIFLFSLLIYYTINFSSLKHFISFVLIIISCKIVLLLSILVFNMFKYINFKKYKILLQKIRLFINIVFVLVILFFLFLFLLKYNYISISFPQEVDK
jgi:hypothetical protein